MKLSAVLTQGLWKENPTLRMMLGMCPVLAVSTSATNAIGMGVATLAVLVASNFTIALVKDAIPAQVRIPAYVLMIASLVTAVDMAMAAWFFELHQTLGLFIPLIVVNCIILGRAEGFAAKNTAFASIVDGLGMGLGFTLSITTLGCCRELLGNGSIFGIPLLGDAFKPMLLMVLPPGAFLMLGLLAATMRRVDMALEARARTVAEGRRQRALDLATGGAPIPMPPGFE
ncbi:MAG: electron transport complex subunit RsxE [Nitrospirae bacterium CG18_big_fil_WC_8_21_14_2_50_70_55]|nr:electron transport complex subunit E [Deltaproteobacteria bacterium]PIQ03870.1 MAG: electron transport complex subunit RsxE [Nitrospirae bacterium CG18_big_fil_WC_8_21_14_2_50_70_55]PIU79857.1 MAG: electron transport complex subunit RsxE [Nitrospirae bacterium CG06_land_8_20_14_3_00_70_43]PIW82520.1 MAG: electron transport complex subunit RsxE [Nitrospirae bacterium CG_4_8_14_3_um_filter_70_85]HBB41468.1 electron transport complex subunit RsxE [Pseudomonadota bacterium]